MVCARRSGRRRNDHPGRLQVDAHEVVEQTAVLVASTGRGRRLGRDGWWRIGRGGSAVSGCWSRGGRRSRLHWAERIELVYGRRRVTALGLEAEQVPEEVLRRRALRGRSARRGGTRLRRLRWRACGGSGARLNGSSGMRRDGSGSRERGLLKLSRTRRGRRLRRVRTRAHRPASISALHARKISSWNFVNNRNVLYFWRRILFVNEYAANSKIRYKILIHK